MVQQKRPAMPDVFVFNSPIMYFDATSIRITMRHTFLPILLLLSFSHPVLTQENGSPQYVVSHWGMSDGLPQSSVNDIVQTKDGYLWLATFGGLVRFDGVSFTTFDRSNTKGMQSDRLLALFEDRQGALWCSTENGLIRFQNDSSTSYTISDNSQNFSPLMIAEDSREVLWMSVNGKPYRYSNGTIKQIAVVKDSAMARQALKAKGSVWLAHQKVVLRTLGDTVVQILDLHSLLKSNIKTIVEYPAGSGTCFIGTSGDGILRYKNGTVTPFTEKDGLPSNYIWKFYIDRENTLWVNSYNGQCQWNGNGFTPFKAIPSTKDIQYNCVFEDTEGDYWIGTPANGLFKLQSAIISTIGVRQGIWNEKMLSLTKLNNGTMLFGTNCGGVYEWNHGKATYSSVNAFLPNLCVWSIFQDSKRNIWMGSAGLYRCRDLRTKGVSFNSSNGFEGTDVHAISEDSRGNIWIGCWNGVFVYNGKSFHRYSTDDGLCSNDARVFFEDPSGTMWIGTTGGVNTIHKGTVTTVELLDSNGDSIHPYIRAIHRENDGTMWFGSYGNGLIRLKNGTVTFVTTAQGLFDNIVSHIVEDPEGNFWMGCNRGIFRVSRKELNDVCDGRSDRIHSFSFGTAEGMQSAETNGGFQPNVIFDSPGTIYFPTVSGVAVVNIDRIRHNSIPPPVRIEKVSLENVEIPLTDPLMLEYDSTYLEIHYAALSYKDPTKIYFKYRLEGLQNAWIDAGRARSVVYSKIPPGEYTFRVIASNNEGVWNTNGASIRISVSPPYWLTWWFRGTVILFILFVGPSVYFYRVTQLKKEKMIEELFTRRLIDSQEQERRRIAAELHDGLGQQILVIKNRAEIALQHVEDAAKTAEQLREIVQSSITSIADVRSISHGLRPAHLEQFGLTETITALGDQLQKTSDIEWMYHADDIDGMIPKEREINFYRVLQEGANNILKHSSARQASMMVRRSADTIDAMLWDDGKGFDVMEGARSGGMGLSGMQERIKTLGGSIEIASNTTGGTVIKISIPIQQHG